MDLLTDFTRICHDDDEKAQIIERKLISEEIQIILLINNRYYTTSFNLRDFVRRLLK